MDPIKSEVDSGFSYPLLLKALSQISACLECATYTTFNTPYTQKQEGEKFAKLFPITLSN